MNSKNIGNVGEARALYELVSLNIPVYIQFGDNELADYIILLGSNTFKVQIKSSNSYNGEVTYFDLTTSSTNYSHKYSKNEIDIFILYDYSTRRLFVIRNTGEMSGVNIRYKKSKNNQRIGVRYADDCELNLNNLIICCK